MFLFENKHIERCLYLLNVKMYFLQEQTSQIKQIYDQIDNAKNTPVSCKTAAEKKSKNNIFPVFGIFHRSVNRYLPKLFL